MLHFLYCIVIWFSTIHAWAQQHVEHNNLLINLEQAVQYAANNQWQKAEIFSRQSKHANYLLAAVKVMRIYNHPEDFALAEIHNTFLQEKWIPIKPFQKRIEKSLSLNHSVEDLNFWFKQHPPITNHGKVLYALFNNTGTNLSAVWRDSPLDLMTEKELMSKIKKHLANDDILYKTHYYLFHARLEEAKYLISLLPQQEARQVMRLFELAQNPSLLSQFLHRGVDFASLDPLIQYLAVKYLFDNKHEDQAAVLLKQVSQVVDGEIWFDLIYPLSRNAFNQGQINLAYELITKHNLSIRSSNYVEAEFFAGWLGLRFLEEPHKGLQHFQNMYNAANYAATKAKASYWLSMAYKALQQHDQHSSYLQEATKYPGSFYSHLAMAKVYKDQPVNYFLKQNKSEDNSKVKRLALFIAMLQKANMPKLSKALIEELVDYDTDSHTINLAVTFLRKSGLANLAVELSSIASNKAGFLSKDGYPNQLAVERDLPDKEVYLAIIRQESRFDQNAISNRGARGLMQLMPDTAHMMAKKLKLPLNGYIKSGTHNTLKGIAFFNETKRKLYDNYLLAICSYNAGPGNVKKWIERYGNPHGKSLDFVIDWIEAIPFVQTRLYAKKVLENAVIYDYLNSTKHKPITIYKYLHNMSE